MWPPLYEFACRKCGQVYNISAGDIYEFDGNHLDLKNSAKPHMFKDKIAHYKGEYKWYSTPKDFFTKYFYMVSDSKEGRFVWQKMGMAVLDARFVAQGIIDKAPPRPPESAGLITGV